MNKSSVKASICLALSTYLGCASALALPEVPCPEVPERFLEVNLSGLSRGGQVVRLGPGEAWLTPEALVRGEEGYAVAQTVCEDVTLYRLDPRVALAVDETSQLVTFTADPQLLARTIHPARLVPTTLPVSRNPAFGVTASAGVDVSLRPLQPTGEVGVVGQVVWSGITAEGGARLAWSGEQLRLSPSLGVTYQPNLDFSTALSWTPLDDRRGLNGQFSLVHLPQRRLPDVQLALPLNSAVELYLDGALQEQFEAPAGPLLLTDLLLTRRANTLKVVVRDALNIREYDYRWPVTFTTLYPREWRVTGSAVRNNEGLQFKTSASYGLTARWALAGEAQWKGTGEWTLEAGVVGADEQQRGTLGVTAKRSSLAPAEAFVFGQYERRVGPVKLSVGSEVSLNKLQNSSVSLGLSMVQGAVSLGAQVGYSPATSFSGGAQVGYRVSRTVQVVVGANRLSDQWRFSLRSQVDLGRAGQLTADGTARGGTLGGGLSYTYLPTPESEVRLSARPGEASATYSLVNPKVQGAVEVRTPGAVQASVSSGMTLYQNRWSVTRQQGMGVLLLGTGRPNLRVLLNSRYVGTTDASGDLVVTGLSPGTAYALSVDLDQLPIDLTVKQAMTTFLLSAPGVVELDWAENFAEQRLLRFYWADGTPARAANLEVGATVLYLDDEGYLLEADLPAEPRVTLVSQDGRKRCPVRMDLEHGEARCTQ